MTGNYEINAPDGELLFKMPDGSANEDALAKLMDLAVAEERGRGVYTLYKETYRDGHNVTYEPVASAEGDYRIF